MVECKTEKEIISELKAHGTRMRADIMGVIDSLSRMRIMTDAKDAQSLFRSLEKTIEKWQFYINDAEFKIQELYSSRAANKQSSENSGVREQI